MRRCAFGLTLAASVYGFSAEGVAGLCDAPKSWPGDASADIVFTGVSAFQTGARGDGPDQPMPVSLNGDVLGLGEELSLSASGLAVQGPVICVRYRPEWLGFVLANTGTTASGGVLSIGPVQGMQLEAELPRLMPGEVRRVLVMGGEYISTIPADAFEIRIDSKKGEEL